VFILNAVLGFVFLLLLYVWARHDIGNYGAATALLLICTLPLLAQNATSAGFEVFNLCMILALALAARRYLEKPGVEGLDLMIGCDGCRRVGQVDPRASHHDDMVQRIQPAAAGVGIVVNTCIYGQ
jgi:hypothetical protein